MRKTLIIACVLLIPFIGIAQSKTWKPWAVAEAGLLVGSYGPSGDLRLQGGMKKGGWMFGAGFAHDGYKYESLPVYAQARKMFGQKRIKPFVMGSVGPNFEMVKEEPQNVIFFSRNSSIWAAPEYNYAMGLYSELGAGLAFRTHKTFGFNISFSYTRKTLTETSTYTNYNNGGAGETNSDESKYLMNRWSFRLAISY